jgi:CRP/FNR family transcriptional regulator, nitrogen oxide reductase regulator
LPEDIATLLRRHPIFNLAEKGALSTLAATCTVRSLAAKEVLYRAKDPATKVFLLLEGLIRVFQSTPDGLEATVTTLVAPNAFGEKTIIAESAGAPALGYPESTMASTSSKVVEIPAEAYLEFLKSSPSSAFELLRDICCRFTLSARREVDVMLPVHVRLASLLLSFAEAAGQQGPDGITIRLALTHDDLAHGLGVATKSVQRTLREWAAEDLVTRKKGWLVIRDAEALAELCGEHRTNHVYRYLPPR